MQYKSNLPQHTRNVTGTNIKTHYAVEIPVEGILLTAFLNALRGWKHVEVLRERINAHYKIHYDPYKLHCRKGFIDRILHLKFIIDLQIIDFSLKNMYKYNAC